MNVEARATAADWPPEDLEFLERCPACEDARRTLRFAGLEDRAFGVALGKWNLWDCGGCGCAYLDPRPAESSIARAYGNYYTHVDLPPDSHEFFERVSGLNMKVRRQVGYLNSKYGYRFSGGVPDVLSKKWPLDASEQLWIDSRIRNLPAPRSPGAKLLDIGCANGEFLRLARKLGYNPIGLEFDPNPVESGRKRGLDIRLGRLGDQNFSSSEFEHITLSHTFEHLHWPADDARTMLRLLKPGGRLWLSMPNLGALGLQQFGENWRGLETPRHLCLFSFESAKRLLENVGFVRGTQLPSDETAASYLPQSAAMAKGLLGKDADRTEMSESVRAANLASRRNPEVSESLTLVAYRPT
jgi:2-polyprenyl-3-methyl-5-hydroxy-6-metoxy-1,4-benzoquinol methylase